MLGNAVKQTFGKEASSSENMAGITHNVIAGFIFLRFFCAAIATPESFGLLTPEVAKENRQKLIPISKVLTNLANEVKFGAKEEGFEKMNEFIDTNLGTVNKFYEEMAQPVEGITDVHQVPSVKLPDDVKENSLLVLRSYVEQYKTDLCASLDQKNSAESKKTKEELLRILETTEATKDLEMK